MTFGERITYCRKQLGITQKDLAQQLEISPTRLNYWEKDKREPDIIMLNKLCLALNVDADFLLGRMNVDSSSKLSSTEKEHIKKYRTLDEYGKDVVDLVLEAECRRVQAQYQYAVARDGVRRRINPIDNIDDLLPPAEEDPTDV